MSNGERDLRAVLNQPDAATQLREVLPGATPAGQLCLVYDCEIVPPTSKLCLRCGNGPMSFRPRAGAS